MHGDIYEMIIFYSSSPALETFNFITCVRNECCFVPFKLFQTNDVFSLTSIDALFGLNQNELASRERVAEVREQALALAGGNPLICKASSPSW